MAAPSSSPEFVSQALTLARAAEAIALKTLGKVRTLCLAAALAALWLSYALAERFDWSLTATLSAAFVLGLPALVLWRNYATLRALIGLPQRVAATATRIADKTQELKARAEMASLPSAEVRSISFRALWATAKQLIEVKGLSDATREIVATLGGALIVANPLFAVVLAIASGAALLLIAVAFVSALFAAV